jgi:hypothetical protein
MVIQILWKDDERPRKTVWINETTAELVTVVGLQCPVGCRELTLEEADEKVMHCREYAESLRNAKATNVPEPGSLAP